MGFRLVDIILSATCYLFSWDWQSLHVLSQAQAALPSYVEYKVMFANIPLNNILQHFSSRLLWSSVIMY